MTPKDFTKKSLRTDLSDYSPIITRLNDDKSLLRLIHAGIGISGESGELLDALKKSMMYGKKLDKDHLVEECGDVLYYMSLLLDELGSSFEECMTKNVEKLEKRYPSGFNDKHAIERLDKNEK